MGFFFDLFSSDKAKFNRDVKTLTTLLRKDKPEWVPIDDDEIEAIALKVQNTRRKRSSMTKYRVGEIRTIFHELLASYGLRSFGKSKGVIAVQTNPYLYTYLIKPKYVEVRINDNRFAYILASGTIKNSTGKKAIGVIDFKDVNHPEVEIGDNNFGILNRPSPRTLPHERAIQMMRPMEEGIKELFIAVTFFYIISEQTNVEFKWTSIVQ